MSAGRKPGPIAAPFAHMPRHEAVVYICELSDGSVKVGYSFQPRQRFTMMARQLARSGRCILQSRLFPVSEQGAYALERRAISALFTGFDRIDSVRTTEQMLNAAKCLAARAGAMRPEKGSSRRRPALG